MEMITSSQNPLVKHLVKLRQNRKYRQEQKSVLISSAKLIREISHFLTPKTLLVSGQHITPEVLKKITGLPTPEGTVAEFPMPEPTPLTDKKSLLVLDTLTDPGNVGTLVRTALALGWEGLYLLSGSVDLFNEKALTAARGASFRLPYAYGNWETLQTLIREKNFHVYIADASGKSLEEVSPQEPLLLILGSEAHGITEAAKNLGETISIPISEEAESLNVAVAGGILMHRLKRAR